MFIHFAPNTWQDREYDDLSTPLEKIDPARLDTKQWVDVAEAMGARYIVFVAKHVGGFCWWQTETTDYSVRSIPWRGGRGDVLRDLSASCREKGIGLGVYLSPADRKHGAAVGGKCPTKEAQARYDRLYRAQLTEVLSRYGEMMEVWFDGSLVVEVGDILKRHAPRAMVFQGKYATIRWVGNEEGIAPYPAWNSVATRRDPARWGVYTAVDGDPSGDAWIPNECDARIRRHWFWNRTNAATLKSVEQLMEMYYGSVGRGAVLLLNNTPDTTGLIPAADARRSAELGREIRRRFGDPILEASGRGDLVELRLATPTEIDHSIVMEDIREGERVLEYVVEVSTDTKAWKEVARGSAIGHKRIDRFPAVTAKHVRWRALRAQARPIVRRFAIFRATPPPAVGPGEAPEREDVETGGGVR